MFPISSWYVNVTRFPDDITKNRLSRFFLCVSSKHSVETTVHIVQSYMMILYDG